MVQEITLYQARAKTTQGIIYTSPHLSTNRPWLGEGYYFWEHELSNAMYWGERFLHGNFDIYESSYLNNDYGLDFVDNYRHIERLYEIYEALCSKSDATVHLSEAIVFIKTEIKGVRYIRFDDERVAFGYKRSIFEVPTESIGKRIKKRIQVCFPEGSFPCPEIGFTTYKSYSPIIG